MTEETDMPVIQFIAPAPEGFNISREAWSRLPIVVRDDIVRMHRELSERIPIAKDRAARRRSRSLGGHFELFCCERDGNVARAAELREALAGEIAHHAAVEERDAALEPYHQMAAAAGKKLPNVLREYIGVESRLKVDFDNEFRRIAERFGVDLESWATVTAAGYVVAHSSLTPAAAQAVRAGRLPVLPADAPPVHIGFMADEVECVRPDCVAMQPSGFLAVDYERLSKTPEVWSLPLYGYRYKDGGDGSLPAEEVA
jgi:hypothetical protein